MTELERTKTGSIKGVGGRPPGSKNKTSLFKEAMKEGFEKVLETEGMKVFMATVQGAIGREVEDEEGNLLKDSNGNQVYEGGSDACKKMILDRIVPTNDESNLGKDKFNISINVVGMDANIEVMKDDVDLSEPMDAEYEKLED